MCDVEEEVWSQGLSLDPQQGITGASPPFGDLMALHDNSQSPLTCLTASRAMVEPCPEVGDADVGCSHYPNTKAC